MRALYHERPIEKLIVCGRETRKAEALAARLREEMPGVHVISTNDSEQTTRASDVLIRTTTTNEPIVLGEYLRPGQHITAIGADTPEKCELDAACFLRADRIVVDSIEDAQRHGDIHRHVSSASLSVEHIDGEIGSILSGKLPGRTSTDQITIAKFVGLGVQDVAAAEVALCAIGSERT